MSGLARIGRSGGNIPAAIRSDLPALLSVEGVSCRFGSRRVLDAISVTAPAGAVTCLVGPSGCGKTTLLRVIAGIERPAEGRVLVDGEEVAGPGTFVLPEDRRIGLMFQDYALFPHLSVRDNVMFGLGGRSRAENARIADAAIAGVGLAALADSRPGQLSGGEQQRTALARALAPAPRVLLMDEPFSNLDRGLRDGVREATLSLLRRAGVTTIIVTHDPEEALAVADHLVILSDGAVLQAGPPHELYGRPSSLAAARALSDVNEVPGRFGDGCLVTPFGSVPSPVGPVVDGAAGVLCVRPEDVRLGPAGVPGIVTARVFRGASTVVAIAVEGLIDPLRATLGPVPPAIGDPVRVSLVAERGVVFRSAADVEA